MNRLVPQPDRHGAPASDLDAWMLFTPSVVAGPLRAALAELTADGAWEPRRQTAVFLGDARRAAAALVAAGAGSPREAAWAVSEAMADAAWRLEQNPGVAVLTERALLERPVEALGTFLADLGLFVHPAALAAAGERFASESCNVRETAAGEPWLEALGLFDVLPPPPGAEVAWPRSLFQGGDQSGEACPAAIDITGRGRILVYGPYMRLPPGRWRAHVAFELCADAARRPFRLQFAAGDALVEAVLTPREPGRQTLSVECNVFRPAPAELRLWLDRASFQGEVRFIDVQVEHLGRAAPDR